MQKTEEEVKPKETIEVNKEKLESLINNYEALQKKVSLLEEVADKNEIAKYIDRHRDITKRNCRIRYLRDEEGNKLVVVGWGSMPTNEVFIGPNGLSVAKQTVKIQIENKDGQIEEKIADLLELGRRYEYMSAEVSERTQKTNDKGEKQSIWKIKAENGREYVLDEKFIN